MASLETELLDALEVEPEQIVILERNRGWLALKAEILARCDKEERRILREILISDDPVDQRVVDRARGMIQALRWVATLPERRARSASGRRRDANAE